MTHDDGNSLIRYLYYSSFFDLEALIVTNQLPDFNYNDTGPWEKAMGILEAYRNELPQLRKHDPNLPDYESLLAVTKAGRGAIPIIWLTNSLHFKGAIASRYVESRWDSIRFDDWIGEGLNPNGEPKDSEGSEFLQEVFNRDDNRPIYVQAWAGPITFIQALYRYRQREGEDKFRKLLSKLHIYGILLQDITFDYLIDLNKIISMNCTNTGTATSTYKGERVAARWLLHEAGHFWRYVSGRNPVISPSEVNGHGPMSEIYDSGGEGDTPSFLYLISSMFGLNDPEDPTQGSWGNMFYPMEDEFPKGYFHTCFQPDHELTRWIPDARNSFKNRLKWSVDEPDEVNQEPIIIINGNKSNKVIHISSAPGRKVKLDASRSFDPDNNDLTYNWFRYKNADSYEGDFEIDKPEEARQVIRVPEDLADKTIHLVLEVRDNGIPGLVSYRRVILNLKN